MIRRISLILVISILFSVSLINKVDSIHQQNGPMGSIKINVQDDETIEKKITIIVGDEEPPVATTIAPKNVATTTEQGLKNSTNSTEPQEELYKIKIDETTRVIFVDESNDEGLLFGKIGHNNEEKPANISADQKAGERESLPALAGQKLPTDRPNSDQVGSPANFSVYLISRNKNHVAILLDIEEIDFEPIINCEYQEVRFSIVGEISKQILDRKNVSDLTLSPDLMTDDELLEELRNEGADSSENPDLNQTPGHSKDPAASSLPVSEAMALIMNAPLNMTIMDDSEDTNDFRLIDTTIDYLFEETCRETSSLIDNANDDDDEDKTKKTTASERDQSAGKPLNSRNSHRHNYNHNHHNHQHRHHPPRPPHNYDQYHDHNDNNNGNGKNRHRHNHRNRPESRRRQRSRTRGNNNNGDIRPMRRKPVEPRCEKNSTQFKELMSSKLNEFLEWDDFKIVCGKTAQLVIPMRSLKLSVFSDEFAPTSSFSIRYKFVSDPSQLAGHDSGKYFCRNRNVIDISLKCDGYDDCGDASDESVKICGYPVGRNSNSNNNNEAQQTSRSRRSKSPSWAAQETKADQKLEDEAYLPQDGLLQHHYNGHHSPTSHRRKLTYFSGDVLHCCQSTDWHNIVPQAPANQAINLQSLIGESMKLFSGPLFAPTRGASSSSSSSSKPKRRYKRIVGGSEAHKGSWPGQVSLQYELIEPLCHFCAGTLIHPQYVLTAGHCITKDGLARGIKVALGAHDLRQLNGSNVQVRYVDDAHIYPGVDVKHLSFDWENDMNNDIALLRLNAPVLLTPNVAPACLPPFNTPLSVNTTCRSIGWGQTHGSGSSNLLKHLSLKVVDSSVCSRELLDKDNESKENPPPGKKKSTWQQSRRSRSPIGAADFESTNIDAYSNQTMICMNNDLGHGICQGDSGGPLYCDRVTASGEHCTEIYGVASFIIQYATVGAMCAVENLPGIFGEVSSKTEWISSTIKMFEQSYRLKYS